MKVRWHFAGVLVALLLALMPAKVAAVLPPGNYTLWQFLSFLAEETCGVEGKFTPLTPSFLRK